MARTYFSRRNKPDVLEVVIQQAVIAVQGRRLFLRVEASGYGMTHSALLQNLKKNSEMATIAIGAVCLLHFTRVSRLKKKNQTDKPIYSLEEYLNA
jgi:hypothetical protein